jgi:hypothetical protein
MAKGDLIKITLATPTGPIETGMGVTKAGRRLTRKTVTKAKVQWVVVSEVKHTGKATGTSIEVRQDAILSIVEKRAEDA